MKIIISGAGAVGLYLAKMLSQSDHDIVIIDTDNERLKIANSHYDVMTVQGNSTLISTLEKARACKTDLLIAVTSYHDINILTCMISKKLGVKSTIARISDSEYLLPKEQEIYKKLGVDQMIFPERIAALEIIDILHESAATESISFSHGKLTLLTIRINKGADILNKTLNDITKAEKSVEFRAIAIKRKGKTIIPSGNTYLTPDDKVYVITKKIGIKKMLSLSGNKTYHFENIMIIGGNKVAKRIGLELEKNYNLKIIEKNRAICEDLTSVLDNALIINAESNDIEMLQEEGLSDMDVLIAVSDNSEANIFSCLIAKNMGVKKTIALVDNIEYIDISQNIGIDTIINKKLIAASYIHKFTIGADIHASKCLSGIEADILEFVVKPKSKITKKCIKNIKFPAGAIIGGVIRENESFIAVGDSKIIAGDHVVVFSGPDVINKVEKFFN